MSLSPVIIGNCTLYNADCRDVLPELGRSDLLLTDPPYGVGESSSKNSSRGRASKIWPGAKNTDYGDFDWDKEPAPQDLLDAFTALARESIIWGGNYFTVPPSRGWLVWDKQNSGNFADCELAWTNIKMSVRIYRQTWNGMIRGGEESGVKRVHPTQKPVGLMRWCLEWPKKVESVIDPFMGSCPVGQACLERGIAYTGIERESRYFDAACERIERASAQGRLFA
jgi:DNA modification methylase